MSEKYRTSQRGIAIARIVGKIINKNCSKLSFSYDKLCKLNTNLTILFHRFVNSVKINFNKKKRINSWTINYKLSAPWLSFADKSQEIWIKIILSSIYTSLGHPVA